MLKTPSPEIIQEFIAIVGKKNVRTKEDDLSHYTDENRNILVGKTSLVLRPGNPEEVAEIVKLANQYLIGIVPQGGHTGHAGGGAPDESGNQIIICMDRMNAVRDIDLAGNTAVVEAGVVLEKIQTLASDHDRLFPLSLASQGSCQIGGNISTNAGGTGVLSYGNTRALILGLEVVTANGEIWHGLKRLKKDNTGYDLRDLFIGAEGTLGIITAAVIKLFPKPKSQTAVLAGLQTPEDGLKLFIHALSVAGSSLTAFEFMPRIGINALIENYNQFQEPFDEHHPWVVLTEFSSTRDDDSTGALAEKVFSDCIENGTISDAIISQNESQRKQFWNIRETMPESQKYEGASIKHDISVGVHLVPEFLVRAERAVLDILPSARIFAFGHMGDGNIHFNIAQPKEGNKDEFLDMRDQINNAVHHLVVEMGGSISAEHGIGRLKRDLLAKTKSTVEMEMMRSVKCALDPNGIMNPGKVL